ncbi:MAG: hypothetical protein AB1698_01645 [Pseudomonadota bacterium]
MCFGGGGRQPAAPTNPAPYSLADASKQVVTDQSPAKTKPEDDAAEKITQAGQPTNVVAPAVLGGAGTNFKM